MRFFPLQNPHLCAFFLSQPPLMQRNNLYFNQFLIFIFAPIFSIYRYKPGPVFRAAVIGTQGVFMTLYTLFYAISPRHCHAFVAYLEEEAVKTYTHCIDDIDEGNLPEWTPGKTKVPEMAIKYWRLDKDASVRDLLLAVRADELCHSHVNQVFATIKKSDTNPFVPGTTVG